jgi:solute carrier family 13 (sodium-dependent dicarboxylate transporter), member 2/3/5
MTLDQRNPPDEAPPPNAPTLSHTGWRLAFPFALGILAVWLLGSLTTVPREVALMTGIFVLAALLWVTQALPLFATSLLVIGLQVVLLANPGGWTGLGFETGDAPSYRDILGAAADPVLVLFFGGLVLARAVVKTGLDRVMCGLLLRPFGTEPRWVLLGLMLITLLFSMWMSNTATTAMMLALSAPVVATLPPKDPFRKALALGVPFAANIGGVSTPIASPPNAVALGFLEKAGHQVSFLDWMVVAVPLMLGLALFAWFVLCKSFPPGTSALRLEQTRERPTRPGWIVLGVLVVTVVLWLTGRWHGVPSAVVALLPVVALSAAGVFTRDDLGEIEWSILILIAGGISLGAGMQMTGLDQLAVQWLPTSGKNNLWLLAALVVATMVLGSFMSNTAAANLLLPVGLAAAAAAGPEGGLHPVHVALSIALAASLAMPLPISTPPNAIAFAKGEFATRDMARIALIIAVPAALLIITGGGWVLRFWGLLR